MTCKNGDTALPARAKYCPDCGQAVREFARPWQQFIREAVSELFDLDGRMLASLRLLLYMAGYWIVALRVAHGDSWTRSVLKFLGLNIVFLPILTASIEIVAHT